MRPHFLDKFQPRQRIPRTESDEDLSSIKPDIRDLQNVNTAVFIAFFVCDCQEL